MKSLVIDLERKVHRVLAILLIFFIFYAQSQAQDRIGTVQIVDQTGSENDSTIREYSRGYVFVQLTDIVPMDFNRDGYAIGCHIKMHIANETKYHLNWAVFKVGTVSISIPEMVANTESDYSYDINFEGSEQCTQSVISKYQIFDCNMRGIAEGDCQKFIRIVSTIDRARINELRKIEAKKIDDARKHDESEREMNRKALSGILR